MDKQIVAFLKSVNRLLDKANEYMDIKLEKKKHSNNKMDAKSTLDELYDTRHEPSTFGELKEEWTEVVNEAFDKQIFNAPMTWEMLRERKELKRMLDENMKKCLGLDKPKKEYKWDFK